MRPEILRNAALAELRHNLRTPANHVLGYTEMLLEDANDARDAESLDALRHVHSAARAALADVNHALANREEVDRDELRSLYERVLPRLERIRGSADAVRSHTRRDDWKEDLDRITSAADAMLALLGDRAAEVEPETAEQATTSPAIAVPTSGPKILVVDDNATNRNMLSRRLRRQGYAVEEARHGSEALDRAATEDFDLILLDIRMPVMDGFEVLARMKQDRRMRSIPVAVIAAIDEIDTVVRAIEMGAEDYVFKPFDPVLLRARIGAILEQKRLRQELAVQDKLKNPLNCVTNFARISAEIVEEQRKQFERIAGRLEEADRKVLRAMSDDLAASLAKIREHAERANRIVDSMLAHSRGEETNPSVK